MSETGKLLPRPSPTEGSKAVRAAIVLHTAVYDWMGRGMPAGAQEIPIPPARPRWAR